MKNLILVTITISFVFVFHAQVQGQKVNSSDAKAAISVGAEITFENNVLDFGEIAYASDGKRQFRFTNTGNEPLIISRCQKSCGCTVPTCPVEPILPGESGVIDVAYDTKREGAFNKTITVWSNATSGTKVIRIKGHVLPSVPE